MEQNENTLSVLKIAPGQYPQQVEIDNNLKALQEAVGGTIAAVYPFADPVAIICNDDGKLMGLPLNRALRDENGEMYDAIAGDFLVVGLGEFRFCSFSGNQFFGSMIIFLQYFFIFPIYRIRYYFIHILE